MSKSKSREAQKRDMVRARISRNLALKNEGLRFQINCGVSSMVSLLTGEARERMLTSRLPKVEVQLDPSCENDPKAIKMRESLLSVLDHPLINISDSTKTSIQKFVTVGLGMINWMSDPDRATQEDFEFIKNIRSILRPAFDILYKKVLDELVISCHDLIAYKSDLRGSMYWFDIKMVNRKTPKAQIIVVFGSTAAIPSPHNRPYHTGNKFRAYWNYQTTTQLLDVAAESFGGTAGETYPVWVSDHALDSLRDRVEGIMENTAYALFRCLQNPVVLPAYTKEGEPPSYLVEFRWDKFKIGYLVCRVIKNELHVITFLFITMDGTPESQNLFHRHRLRRHDIEYSKLNNFESLLRSDLFDDPLFFRILTEAGCGDIAEIRRLLKVEKTENLAEDLRKYMRIDTRKEKSILDRYSALPKETET